jgi:hypothetical protein
LARRTRIVEGTWDCTSCGGKGIPGREPACPACGNPRDAAAELRFDFGTPAASGASPRETVGDPALLARAQAGPDWPCAFCGAGNPGDAAACRGCGAPREAPPAPPPVARAAVGPAPGRKARGCLWLSGCGCLAGVVVFASLAALGYWGERTREHEGRVVERTWRREVARERFTAVVREGWQDELRPRATVMPVRGLGEVAGIERIRDCVRRQRGTRKVEDGTREVCEDRTRSVECGTEERCRTRDLGNGFAEETCEDVPRYCDETYRDCRDETRYREEPVYGVRCRFDSWEWQPAGTAVEEGRDTPPAWPRSAVSERERERRVEAYEAVVEYRAGGETRRHRLRLDAAADYEAWTAGREVKVEVTNFGDVKAVRLQGP